MIARVPLPGKFVGMTVHPRLLILSRTRFPRLEAWRQLGVLQHEAVHAEQMRRDGWLCFVTRYLFSGEWRARYELEAYRVNLAALIGQGALEGPAVESVIATVRRPYYPRWWFGRPPSVEEMRVMLIPGAP